MSSVNITVMDRATRCAFPLSYSEICDTFRATRCRTPRTDPGRTSFVDYAKRDGSPTAFVIQHVSERAPTSIQHGLGHPRLSQSGSAHVTDEDCATSIDKTTRRYMQIVSASILNLRMDRFDTIATTGALRCRQRVFKFPVMLRVLNLLTRRQSRKGLETKVNANRLGSRTFAFRYVKTQIDVPASSRVFGKRTALDHGVSRYLAVLENRILAFQVRDGRGTDFDSSTGLKWNPPKGSTLAGRCSVAWPFLVLVARLRKLLSDVRYRIGMQIQVFGGTGTQTDKVEAGRPTQVPASSVFLRVDEIIPDEVHRPCLIDKVFQPANTVAVNDVHVVDRQQRLRIVKGKQKSLVPALHTKKHDLLEFC